MILQPCWAAGICACFCSRTMFIFLFLYQPALCDVVHSVRAANNFTTYRDIVLLCMERLIEQSPISHQKIFLLKCPTRTQGKRKPTFCLPTKKQCLDVEYAEATSCSLRCRAVFLDSLVVLQCNAAPKRLVLRGGASDPRATTRPWDHACFVACVAPRNSDACGRCAFHFQRR